MASGNLPVHPDGLDPRAIERPLYSTVIRPHQSMTRVGFRVVMALCCLVSLVTSIACWRMGFWPIAGFFGLDMLALFAAFKASRRRGRSFEAIVISQVQILLARVSPTGARREWRFNPIWTKMTRVEDDEFGLRMLTLVSRREHVVVARDASPDEREAVAQGLGQALARAKKGF